MALSEGSFECDGGGHRGGEVYTAVHHQRSSVTKHPIPPEVSTSNLLRRYCLSLENNPTVTKACTSLVGFMLGDCLAQKLEGNDVLELARVARLGAYGLLLDGPVGHMWYKCAPLLTSKLCHFLFTSGQIPLAWSARVHHSISLNNHVHPSSSISPQM